MGLLDMKFFSGAACRQLAWLGGLLALPVWAGDRYATEREAGQHCPQNAVVSVPASGAAVVSSSPAGNGGEKKSVSVCRAGISPAPESLVQGWRRIAEDETRVVYLGMRPVERRRGAVTVLTLVDFKQPAALDDGTRYRSWETQYEFDCVSKKSRVVAVSMFVGNMGEGEVSASVLYEAQKWEAIPAGSNGESLWRRACGKR